MKKNKEAKEEDTDKYTFRIYKNKKNKLTNRSFFLSRKVKVERGRLA